VPLFGLATIDEDDEDDSNVSLANVENVELVVEVTLLMGLTGIFDVELKFGCMYVGFERLLEVEIIPYFLSNQIIREINEIK
jgi:hypothetical protein